MAHTPKPHTLAHALDSTLCGHSMADITQCVICGKDLEIPRWQPDTCGSRCLRYLLKLQRKEIQP